MKLGTDAQVLTGTKTGAVSASRASHWSCSVWASSSSTSFTRAQLSMVSGSLDGAVHAVVRSAGFLDIQGSDFSLPPQLDRETR